MKYTSPAGMRAACVAKINTMFNKTILAHIYIICYFAKSSVMKITEAQKKKYFKNVSDNIRKEGYHTTAVLEAENSTPFAYSTGIFENFKIPELFISGLGPNLSGQLIKNYADQYKLGKVPLNKRITDLTERFPVYFIKVTNESLSDYVLSSIRHYEDKKYEYLQLVFPDLNGNFPNEPNYDYDQKIFGEFELK